jgi:signal peptidase I
MRSRAVKIMGLIVGGLIVVGLWTLFAPAKLGGSTTYSITSGVSMEPLLHKNDLAIVRVQSSYHVGDIVLYQSPVLHKPVLHRIILIQNGNYFFRGDNNGFVDPGYATRSELVGTLWFSVPAVGAVLSWFGQPFHAALLAGVATMLVAVAGAKTTHRRGRRRRGSRKMTAQAATPSSTNLPPREQRSGTATSPQHAASRRPPPYLEGPTWSLVSLGVALLLALLVSAVGFSRPIHRVAALPGAYQQTGSFSYSAAVKAPTDVYPSGVVKTGQPIYPSVLDAVTLRFEYRFRSALPHHIKGTIELRALLLSTTDTWQELSTVVPSTTFTGDHASITTDLPLAALYTLINNVSAQSGVAGANYSADIQPVVHITGTVGNKPINEQFSPVLPFAVAQTVIRIDVPVAPPPPGATYVPESASAGLASTLHPVKLGSVPHVVANEVAIAKYKVPVSVLRILGIVFGVLALILAVLHDRLRRRRAKQSDEERIASRFHTLIVPVASLALPPGPVPIAVPDFVHLAGLARFLERPILYEVRDGSRTFAVDDDTRRYVTSAVDRRQRRAPSDETPGDTTAYPKPDPKPAATAPPSRHATKRSMVVRGAAGLLVLAVATTLTMSITASTSVPVSNVGQSIRARQFVELSPAGCSSLTLSTLVNGSGTVTNNASNALILGSAGVDHITDNGQDNCIVGGGGKDQVAGTPTDVCIIGPTVGAKYTKCTTSAQ